MDYIYYIICYVITLYLKNYIIFYIVAIQYDIYYNHKSFLTTTKKLIYKIRSDSEYINYTAFRYPYIISARSKCLIINIHSPNI